MSKFKSNNFSSDSSANNTNIFFINRKSDIRGDILPPKKDFIKAKYDFIDEMLKFSEMPLVSAEPIKILDVGCGIGGTSR